MSYGHSALVVVPKVGDLVMIEYNRKFLEKLLKSGSLKCNKLGEYETYYDQYAIVTGIIFPIPERENMGEVDEIDSKVLSRATRPPRPGSGQEKYFMRNPIAHSESVENAKLFIQERMCPEEGDIILYHGNDHEIRLNEREIHLKHRTGSQIIFRENGDIDVYAFRNFHVHAQGNVEINGVIGASLNGDMPKKNRPYRIVT
jgi:hypothetical protein